MQNVKNNNNNNTFILNDAIKINNIIFLKLNLIFVNIFNKSKINFFVNNKHRTIDEKIAKTIKINYNAKI